MKPALPVLIKPLTADEDARGRPDGGHRTDHLMQGFGQGRIVAHAVRQRLDLAFQRRDPGLLPRDQSGPPGVTDRDVFGAINLDRLTKARNSRVETVKDRRIATRRQCFRCGRQNFGQRGEKPAADSAFVVFNKVQITCRNSGRSSNIGLPQTLINPPLTDAGPNKYLAIHGKYLR